MQRPAFDHAWLHANAVAELAFLRSLAKAFVALQAPPSEPDRAAFEEVAQRIANLDEDSFDWSALKGVEGFDADAAPPPADDAPAPTADLSDVPTFGEAVDFECDPEQAPPDVAACLARVAQARAVLEPRIADAHARADHAALDAALAQAGGDVPGLDQPLGATEFTHWLERYEHDDPALLALVEELRRHEPGL